MSQTFSKLVRRLSLPVFLIGLLTSGLIYYSKNYANQPQPMTGFTLVTTQVFTPSADATFPPSFPIQPGVPMLAAIIVRYDRVDGTWRQVTTSYKPDGSVAKVDNGFATPGRGVFRVNEEQRKLTFLSGSRVSADQPYFTEAILRNDPRFIREEKVQGFNTYVLRTIDADGTKHERYYAPALRGFPIKDVRVLKEGVEVREPVQIILGNPPDSVFDLKADDYPIDYNHFLSKIEAAQKSGHNQIADEMRQQMQEMQRREQAK